MTTAEQTVEEQMLPHIREVAENFWRAMLTTGSQNPQVAEQLTQRFDTRIAEIATGLGGDYGQAFKALAERERERLFQEYCSDKAAFRRKLGVPSIEELRAEQAAPAAAPQTQYHGSVGETVVRTAVRATVWESVRALFGLLR